MTEVLPYNGGGAVAALPAPASIAMSSGVRSLVLWAQEAEAAYSLAERIVATTFCPQQYRGKPAEAAAAMLAGAEVGLNPMASLRAFDSIQGTATPKALTMRAIAQSQGAQFVTESRSAQSVVMRARRRGGEWERVEWTIGQARALGLAEKDNWKRQPQAMLEARATSQIARLVAADALLGMPYSSEEVADMDGGSYPADLPPPAPRVTVAEIINGRPAPSPEPVAQGEPVADEPPTEPMITAAQSKALHAAMRDNGITERDLGLAFCADVIGRDIVSTKELTKADASRIIDQLAEMQNAGAVDPNQDWAPGADGGGPA